MSQLITSIGDLTYHHNNCFCKERCSRCGNWFDCDSDIYVEWKAKLICYDCASKLLEREIAKRNAWCIS